MNVGKTSHFIMQFCELCFFFFFSSFLALYDLAVLKKKVKEKEKKKKIKLIKSEAEDLAEPLSNTEGVPTLSQAPSPLAISSIKEE